MNIGDHNRLAIYGGMPVRTIPFPEWPYHGPEEEEALKRTLVSGNWWRGSGSEVEALEREFAIFHGSAHALAVTTGTSALELALMVQGVKPGDRVLVPAFTFVSTAMAVQRLGAEPVLYDVDLATYNTADHSFANIDLTGVKAIIPVFIAGQISGVSSVQRLARENGIKIVWDAAHAHNAMYRNQRLGELGAIACFSFQNFKLMTAGEGGMVTFDCEDDREAAFLLHNCGRPRNDLEYRHEVVGTNLRMSEFSAAILRCQLKRLEAQTTLRESNGFVLDERLSHIPGIIPQTRSDTATRMGRYMVMFRLDPNLDRQISRNDVVDALKAEGIPAFRNYPPLYRLRAMHEALPDLAEYELCRKKFPNAEAIGCDGLWIHHRVLLGNEEDALDVARAVEKVVRGLSC